MKRALLHLKRLFRTDLSRKYKQNFNPDRQASQAGEDGIIHAIFRRLRIDQDWFVEFGAWDGVRYSNTYALVLRGWRGVYIEADPERCEELTRNMAPYPDVIPLQCFLTAEGDTRLDAILARTPLPRDFGILSIDIDGIDYWVWQSLEDYSPKLVVIEYNPHFEAHEHKTIRYDPDHGFDGTIYYGASAAALAALAESKGYRLIGYTRKQNLFFLRDDLVGDRFQVLRVDQVPTESAHVQERREEFIDVTPHTVPAESAGFSHT